MVETWNEDEEMDKHPKERKHDNKEKKTIVCPGNILLLQRFFSEIFSAIESIHLSITYKRIYIYISHSERKKCTNPQQTFRATSAGCARGSFFNTWTVILNIKRLFGLLPLRKAYLCFEIWFVSQVNPLMSPWQQCKASLSLSPRSGWF